MKRLLIALLGLFVVGCAQTYPHVSKDGSWGPNVLFVGKASDAFRLTKSEWISGISIEATFTGKTEFPFRLYADLYDHDRKKVESQVRVWHHRVEPGETVSMNIRDFSSPNIEMVKISGTWKDGSNPH